MGKRFIDSIIHLYFLKKHTPEPPDLKIKNVLMMTLRRLSRSQFLQSERDVSPKHFLAVIDGGVPPVWQNVTELAPQNNVPRTASDHYQDFEDILSLTCIRVDSFGRINTWDVWLWYRL